MTYKQEPCPLCGRDMTAIETYPGRGELYCGHCDMTIGGNDAKTPEELIALMDGSEHRRLEAENAKLREQGADMDERRAKTFEVGKRWMAKAARFESENTKLRELVRELWTYAEQELLCDENCSYGAVCDWRDCVFERRMRELGVEVDG